MGVTGGYIIDPPVFEAHGCVLPGNGLYDEELRAVVKKAVEVYRYERSKNEEMALSVRKALKNYFYKTTKQAPLIVVSILDV